MSSNSTDTHNQKHDEIDDENCPDCIQRRKKMEPVDELTKEILMIAPPNIKDVYEGLAAEYPRFTVTPLERTEEEKQRDEEERVKLAEHRVKHGVSDVIHIREADLEESIRKHKKSEEVQPQQQTKKLQQAPKAKTHQRQQPPPNVMNKPSSSPINKPLKLGSAINPEPGPQMDCED